MAYPRRSWAVLAALGWAAGVAAQAGGGRKPTFGRLVDARGEPVAGVEVTFAGGSPHLGEAVVAGDVVVVASDDRGRVRARLRPELCYVAWAEGSPDADGAVWTSEPFGYFAAGAMFELTCRRGSARRATVTGAAAWGEHGPLRYFAVTPYPGVELELEPTADGSLLLPALDEFGLEVRASSGAPLFAARPGEVVELPPPRQVRVRAVDADGAPLAGVTIRHRVTRRGSWRLDGLGGLTEYRCREVGVTDGDGRATVVVPYGSDPLREPDGSEMMLLASAPGRATVAGGTYGRRVYVDERRVDEFTADELRFTLPRVEPLAIPKGLVPAGTRACLAAVCKLHQGGNGYMHDPRTFAATAGADGAVVFEGVPADVRSLRLCLLPEDGEVPFVFSALNGRVLPPEVRAVTAEPLSARLGGLHFRVLDATGGPARGAVAYVVPAVVRGVLQRDSMFCFPLDPAGRGVVQVAPGDWVVFVVTDSGFTAAPIGATREQVEVPLQVEPLSRMHVALVDGEGLPVAGARVRLARSRTRSTGDPLQATLQLFARQLIGRLNSLTTDADGLVVIPFLPVENVTWELRLHWEQGATEPFVLEANEAPLLLQRR